MNNHWIKGGALLLTLFAFSWTAAQAQIAQDPYGPGSLQSGGVIEQMDIIPSSTRAPGEPHAANLRPFTENEISHWQVDRHTPTGGWESGSFNGYDNVLRLGIGDTTTTQQENSTFYRTEGIKTCNNECPDGIRNWGNALEVDLYLDPSWQTTPVRAGIWGTVVNEEGTIVDYPIIEVTTVKNVGGQLVYAPTWRIWISALGFWFDLGTYPVEFSEWVTLRIDMDLDDGFNYYYINGLQVGNFPTAAGSDHIREIILNGYNYELEENFADPDVFGPSPYDINWKNLRVEHTTIEGAVTWSRPGETVEVAPGEYTANVAITHPLTIRGAGAATQITAGFDGVFGVTNTAFYVRTNDVVLEDMALFGAGESPQERGVMTETHQGQNLTLTNLSASGFVTGIYLNPGAEATVTNYTATNNTAGIGTDAPALLHVSGSTFAGNGEGIGFTAGKKIGDLLITGNNFSGQDPAFNIPLGTTELEYENVVVLAHDWGPNLQTAINNAEVDDTILLGSGNFSTGSSQLNLHASDLSIIGSGEPNTTIDVSAVAGYGIEWRGDRVSMSNLTVLGPVSGTYGLKIAPENGSPAPLTGVELTNVTVQGSGRTEIDFHYVDGAVLTNVTADGATTLGVGISMISTSNVTLDNIQTINNGWGGVAAFTNVSQYFPNAGRTTGITIEGHTSTGDLFKFYSEGDDGGYLTGDDLEADHILYTVHNPDHRENGQRFTFYVESLEDAIALANALESPESSAVRHWPEGNWLINEDLTLQGAIAAAASGDTLELDGGVTYSTTGQVVIDKNLTLSGSGDARSKPVITPSGNMVGNNAAGAWWLVEEGVDFTLSNVVLDGEEYWVRFAIRSHGNTTINGVDFRNIQGSLTGTPYTGIAVSSFGGVVEAGSGADSHGSGGDPAHLVVTNSTFEQIGRIGILIKGTESTAEIAGNTYTGKGDGDFLDYAVEVGAGGAAEITGNTISDNRGVASTDGSGSGGIMVTTYYGNAANASYVEVEDNQILDNSTGIYLGYTGPRNPEDTVDLGPIANNNFIGNSYQFRDITGDADMEVILTSNNFDRAIVVRENPIVVSTIFTKIEDAIAAAEEGQTVEVHDGSYPTSGQLVIDKNLSVVGVGGNKPVISPDGNVHNMPQQAWWFVEEGTEFAIENVVLDGGENSVYFAIRSHGATTIEGVDFLNMKHGTSRYFGIAIASFGGTVGGGAGQGTYDSAHLIVSNSTFEEIGRVGVLVKGDESTALIDNNTYTGKGAVDGIDYLVDLGSGGTATISGNAISDNLGVAATDGSTSAGVLVTTFHGPGTNAVLESNTISNSSSAILVGYDENDTSDVVAHHNSFDSVGVGVSSQTQVVDARYNFWGDNSGPSSADPENPVLDPVTGTPADGSGARVSENVRFDEWIGKPAVVTMDSGPGWYMLSAPIHGTTVHTLADANLVYGISGQYPNTDGTNPLIGYSGDNTSENNGFGTPTGLNQPLVPGKGFIWYLWEGGTSGPQTGEHAEGTATEAAHFPFVMNYVGSPVVENYSVQFNADERSATTDDGFYLLGNPYGHSYNVGGIRLSADANIFGSLHYLQWKGGEYNVLSAFDNDEAEVGDGFFMQMVFPDEPSFPLTVNYTNNPIGGPPAPPADEIERFEAHFELSGDIVVFYNGDEYPMEVADRNARVIFADGATDNFDMFDAGKLNPLTDYWANIGLIGMHGENLVQRAIESRPMPHEPVSIPMAFSTHINGLEAGGTFTIYLAEQNLPSEWSVLLTDLETGATVDMLADSYTFSIETQPAIDADERFLITFTPPPVSGEDGGETLVFGMEPIWPNPTVHTSQVAFTIEEGGEVQIDMFDMLGRRVAQVAGGEFGSGRHVLPLNTQQLASGVYVVRLISGSKSAVQRVTVAR